MKSSLLWIAIAVACPAQICQPVGLFSKSADPALAASGTLCPEALGDLLGFAMANYVGNDLSRVADPAEFASYKEKSAREFLLQFAEGGGKSPRVRVRLPAGFGQSAKKFTLVIAMHGAAGSENTFLDSPFVEELPTRNLVRRYADQDGYVVAAPLNMHVKGCFGLTFDESPWGGEVLALARWIKALLPDRIGKTMLMGHSQGGRGALSLALRNPGEFAAVAVFAPFDPFRSAAPDDLKSANMPPVFYAQGGLDPISLPPCANEWIKAARKQGVVVERRLVPAGHGLVGPMSIRAAFEFLREYR